MKKYLFPTFLCCAFINLCYAQSCLPEGIKITNQSQIDSFQINYPGCKVIEGDLRMMTPNESISNLIGLSAIIEIKGNLIIQRTTELNSLSGLNNLKKLGNSLYINYTKKLNDLSALNGLISLGGGISITDNASLKDINGFDSISGTIVSFGIYENDSLKTIAGFHNVKEIKENLAIVGHKNLESFDVFNQLELIGKDLKIYSNDSLKSFTGFQHLMEIKADLAVFFNHSLTNLSEMPSLKNCGNWQVFQNNQLEYIGNFNGLERTKSIRLSNCPSLKSCPNFFALRSYNSCEISINDNGSLQDLLGFRNLKSAFSINISKNNMLPNLKGLDSLADLTGGLSITKNSNLISLNGLESFKRCKSVVIGGEKLTNFDAINQLEHIEETLSLGGLDSAKVLYSFQNLTFVKNVYLRQNRNLEIFGGFDKLESVKGYVYIEENAQLISLTGFDRIREIGGYFRIENNPKIENLDDFDSLNTVGKGIAITNNASLSSLIGLKNIPLTWLNALVITNCPNLSECAVKNICEYLSNPNNSAEFVSNMEGCSSRSEVLLSCGYHDDILIRLDAVSPNPTTGKLNIGRKYSSYQYYQVVNSIGEIVLMDSISSNELDLSQLSAGLYYLVFAKGQETSVVKASKIDP